jgi:hypothetical protein
MPLVKCPECGREVSDRARRCSSCGYPFKTAWGCLFDVILVLILLAVIGIAVLFYFMNKIVLP